MAEKGRFAATLSTLSFSAGFLIAQHRLQDEMKLRACVQEDGSCIPIVTYSDLAACKDIKRGHTFRLDPDKAVSGELQRIGSADGLCPDIFHDNFRMFKQIGGTCSLASTAAILSDLSLRNGGAAIDPYVLSDLIATRKTHFADALSEQLESTDTINIQPGELEHLDGEVPFNPNIGFTIEVLEQADILSDPVRLQHYVRDILRNPSAYILLDIRVSSDPEALYPNHSVVVVGVGRDAHTRESYLLVADPTGGNFAGSENFEDIQEDWYPLNAGAFTTFISLNSRSIASIKMLRVIRGVEK